MSSDREIRDSYATVTATELAPGIGVLAYYGLGLPWWGGWLVFIVSWFLLRRAFGRLPA